MRVGQSTQIFEVELEGTFDYGRVLATFTSPNGTSDNHPCTLCSGRKKTAYLLVPERPVELLNPSATSVCSYKEGLKDAMFSRLCDYMAAVEALDRRLSLLVTSSVDTLLKERQSHLDRRVTLSALMGVNCAAIQDDSGVVWGPFDLSPNEPPQKWPFYGEVQCKGVDRKISLKPDGQGRFFVMDGALSVTLGVSDGLVFASSLAESGGDWRAVWAKLYPRDLGHLNPYRPPAAG